MNKQIWLPAANESPLQSYEINSGKVMETDDPKLTSTTNNDIVSSSSNNENLEKLVKNAKPEDSDQLFWFPLL